MYCPWVCISHSNGGISSFTLKVNAYEFLLTISRAWNENRKLRDSTLLDMETSHLSLLQEDVIKTSGGSICRSHMTDPMLPWTLSKDGLAASNTGPDCWPAGMSSSQSKMRRDSVLWGAGGPCVRRTLRQGAFSNLSVDGMGQGFQEVLQCSAPTLLHECRYWAFISPLNRTQGFLWHRWRSTWPLSSMASYLW